MTADQLSVLIDHYGLPNWIRMLLTRMVLAQFNAELSSAHLALCFHFFRINAVEK